MLVQELVKPAQTRHGKGLSTVYRASGSYWGVAAPLVYVKTQRGYNCRPMERVWRLTPTFLCELQALEACHALGLNVPNIVSYRVDEGITELVLEGIDNARSLDEFWYESSADRLQAVLVEFGRMVGVLHQAGWVHRALGDAHVLIQPHARDKVWLIDFEKARRGASKRQIESDLARFWRRADLWDDCHLDYFFAGYRTARPQGSDELQVRAKRICRGLQRAIA